MKPYSYIFLLSLLLVSCRQEREEKPVTSGHDKASHAKKEPFVLLSSDGDTIPTGVPIPAKGKWIDPDSVAKPKTIPLKGKPKVVPAHTNVHPVGTPNVVTVPKELTVITPGKDGVPFPKTVPANGKTIPARQPPPVPALPPRFKDNAIYDIQYLGVGQNMSNPNIGAIIEDSQGNLWFGTNDGVSRYDGNNFTHYTTKEGLSSNTVLSILEDSHGNLWFGTWNGGVTRYDGNSFNHYTTKEGLSHNWVSSILEDSRGDLWFGTTGGGVNRYDGNSFTHYTTKEGLTSNLVSSMMEDSQGNLWFGTYHGVCRFDPCNDRSSFTHFTTKEGLYNDVISSILEDSRGDLWFGTMYGISRYDGNSFVHYSIEEGLNDNLVLSLLEDSWGNLWAGTAEGGVSRYDGCNFTYFTSKEGLSLNWISSMIEDSQGNLWFGTAGGGVNCYDGNSFTYFMAKERLSSIRVLSILEDSQGNLWFGTAGEGVSRYDGVNFIYFTTEEGLNNNVISSMMEDSQGNLWFGTRGGGVNRFDGHNFTYFTTGEGLYNNQIISMLEDGEGNLWFGTYYGVSRFAPNNDGGNFTNFTTKEGLCDNSVEYILEDRQGDLWFGTWGGISRYDGSNFTHFTINEGLSHNRVVSMLEDDQGDLWFGTDGGLNRYDGSKFTYYTTNEGLSHNWAASILESSLKDIWVSTEKGITLLTPLLNKQSSANGLGADNYRFFTFDNADGLKKTDFELKSACLDRNNSIWWGSVDGFTTLDLNNFKLPNEPPRTRLNHVEIKGDFVGFRRLRHTSYRNTLPFGESLSHSFDSIVPFYNYPANMDLPHHLNHLTFHFSAIDWAAPHKLKYSYKLEGLDENWSIPQSENKADYRNLSFGAYTLKIKAIGAAQVWSNTFEYSFSIRPPWWHTWWAYTLYTLAIAGLLYTIYRVSLNRQLELAETRRLKELDAMKAKFYANITHEFRTPLTIIQGMANQVQRHPGRWLDEGVTAIRRSCKELLRLVNQILDLSKLEAGHLQYNPVRGDIIPFLRYLVDSFHSMVQEKGVVLSFECEPEHLEMDYDQDLISHIVSNLLSNGLKFTPQNGKVLLRVRQSIDERKESFLLEVEDNGQGIPADQLPYIFDRFYQASSIEGQGGTGIGLALVKEIVDILGGKIDVESQVGKGTAFTVSLPISRQAPLVVKDIPLPSIEAGILPADEEMETFGKPLREDAPLILLVEDNEGVIRYLNSLLCHRYLLDKARNGREGLEKAAEIGPDLIISDVMMPEMDGYTFCEKIKADKATSHIPVILLTARATHEGRKEGLSRGADAYIVKPFDQEELFIRIEKLLGLRQKLKEKYWNAARLHLLEDLDVAPRYAAFLEKLDEHIWENIDNPAFKVDQMAAAMYMSRSALFTELKKITRKSPSDYLRDARLALADQLVRNTDLPLNQVAERTGFSSDSYLTKVYRKKFGASPSEVREESAE